MEGIEHDGLDPRFVMMFLVLRSLTYVGWIVDRPNIENAATAITAH